MPQEIQLQIPPKFIEDESFIRRQVAFKLKIEENRIKHFQIIRRSIDARKNKASYVLRLRIWVDENFEPVEKTPFPLQDVSNKAPVHIVGLGPAGLFAALHLIKQGLKPIVIERGKAVRERRRDLARLNKEGIVNPDSNYCFGEGGAGTFSDGKLYTRSTKRGDTQSVLDVLVQFGATEAILIDAHPHIGTNKLPGIIQNMREAILEAGGEIHFDTKLTDFKIESDCLKAIQVNGQDWWPVEALILATGHSARNIFELLHRAEIEIEAKAFALGIRVEHPQGIIDQIQYRQSPRHENLPAASYSLVQQIEGKGVYSFCMCPGGIICPAATGGDEIVVNGWSPSKRNSPFANSGMVVELGLKDFGNDNPLAGVVLQAELEKRAFQHGGGKQVAPAARLTDFLKNKVSPSLPNCSYLPGITAVNMREVLPNKILKRLQGGFRRFGAKMHGYISEEAVVVGVESRTSSPVRIPRTPESLMHVRIEGLFPCGEGAGYAGGIMSAAIDGEKCAKAVERFIS
ncbi:MAG: NAD(P)/FAD-dependent oxidoreductase [Bacteroidia bacterium]